MTRKEYRAAIDAVKLPEDFQSRTIRQLEQQIRKEQPPMKKTRNILFAACLAAALIITAAATIHLLTPGEVAASHGDQTLSTAFSGDGAIVLDETAECGDFTFHLAGMVSGSGLSDFCEDVMEDRSYLVVSRARTDGTPIEEATITDYTITPLVAGYAPGTVNLRTLGGAASAFLQDGIVYYIYDFDSVTMFAGHTVYLAIYEGFHAPGPEIFTQAEDGSITFNPGFTDPHAIFEVPLDPAGADPEAVEDFLREL